MAPPQETAPSPRKAANSKTLYDSVEVWDKGIAEALKKATDNNPHAVIDEKAVRIILAKLLDDDQIGPGETAAMAAIILSPTVSEKALDVLRDEILMAIHDKDALVGNNLRVHPTPI